MGVPLADVEGVAVRRCARDAADADAAAGAANILDHDGLPLSPPAMLTPYSYPELFGVADNNGYGLKVFAFLRLAGVPFRHEHIFDASSAPRGQLPYIVDDG